MKYAEKPTSNLESNRKTFFKVGLSVAILSVIFAFKIPINREVAEPIIDEPEEVYSLELMPEVRVEQEIPEQTPPPKPVFQFKPVPIDPIVPINLPPIGELTAENGLGELDLGKEKDIVEPPMPPTRFPESMPEYPGGQEALLAYLGQTKYCDIDREIGAEGIVHVEFIVDEKGHVVDAKVLKGVSECLNQSALKQVRNMERWTPGQQGLKPVSVIMVAPIRFKLR